MRAWDRRSGRSTVVKVIETGNSVVTIPRGNFIPKSVFVLMLFDLAALALSIFVGFVAWGNPANIEAAIFTGAAVYAVGLVGLGLYPGRGIFGADRVRLRVGLAAIAFISPAIAGVAYSHETGAIAGACLTVGALLAVLGPFLEQIAIEVASALGIWHVPARIMGTTDIVRKIATYLERFPELGMRAVPDTETLGSKLYGIQAPEQGAVPRVEVSDDWDGLAAWLVDMASPLPSFHPLNHAASPTRSAGESTEARVVKRILDVVVSLVLLAMLSPVFLAIMLIIALWDGRPVFFSQNRRGKDGRVIRVWKFRTMYRDADERLHRLLDADDNAREEWQRHFKLRNDPRILPGFGNFLRMFSIDELPQLWNILKGEMSLVGPRPFPEDHLNALPPSAVEMRQRVVPGVTGLWQVTVRGNGDLDDQCDLDRAYVVGWSLWLDLYILFRTPIAVVCRRGAY